MKRFCLISSVAAASLLALAPTASAEPAILYVPAEGVDLYPSGEPDTPCQGVSTSDYNPGLGCVPGLEEAGSEPAYGDLEALTTALDDALAPFDIHVTNDRPPAYLSHYMLHASDDAANMATSYSCSGAPLTCAARGRNAIGFTNGGTMNCDSPDAVQAALHATGRMMGLEGSSNAMDPMHYPPDFMTPATAFQDQCDPLSPLLDPKTGDPRPLECTSADHNGCDAGEQNSVADLMAYFGERVDDTEAPVLSNFAPADGEDLPGGMITFSVEIEDADPIVGVSWTVESPALEEVGGSLTACTNNHCDFNLVEGDPFKPTDSEWSFGGVFPGGVYTVTLEASDYHGNVADTITYMFTVDGGSAEETGTPTTESDSMTGMTGMTTSPSGTGLLETGDAEETGDEDDSGPDMNEDDTGCACTQSPGAGGAMLMLLGVFGFLMTRRED